MERESGEGESVGAGAGAGAGRGRLREPVTRVRAVALQVGQCMRGWWVGVHFHVYGNREGCSHEGITEEGGWQPWRVRANG